MEAFEVMLLSILSSAVKCEWDLEDVEEALITMVTNKSLMSLSHDIIAGNCSFCNNACPHLMK